MRRTPTPTKNLARAGSTEWVVLFCVLAVLLGAVLLVLVSRGHHVSAKERRAAADVKSLALAAMEFKKAAGRFPEVLQELVSPPDGVEAIVTEVPPDPWGHEYAYALLNGTPFVRSAGPDGLLDTADDIDGTAGAEKTR